MRASWRVVWFAQAGLLLAAWPAAAQIKLGELSTKLAGTVSSGYTADFGNMTSSDHNWTVGGDGNFSGSFYNPNFLSYSVDIFSNQSRANSNFQSISTASGVNAGTNLFGGSHFPGSISYSKTFNKEGNYAVPGLSNFVTSGNDDAIGVNWSENLPDAPSFSASYQRGSSQYSVYGTNYDGSSAFHAINLHSSYRLAGFNMGAYYSTGASQSQIPQIVTGGKATETNSDNSAEGFNVTHQLPLHGSISSGINRSTWNTDYLGTSTNGTIDIVNTLASVHPTNRLSVSGSINFSDNLSGQLIQQIVGSGGTVTATNYSSSSNSLDLVALASYSPQRNLQTTAVVERRSQSYLGENYGVTSYGGSATYSRRMKNGNLNAAMMMTANKADRNGQDTVSFSTTENYSSEVLGWKVNASFGYAQNMQTLLVTYMNSYYNFSGNAARRWRKFSMSLGGSEARTGLTDQSGAVNSSQSYNASAGYGSWLTASGSYSKSSGQALETGSGLVPTPGPIPPSSLVALFGGNGYSFALSSAPVRRLILSASYSSSSSNTLSDSIASANQNRETNFLVNYQVRKMGIISGFSRLEQGFSVTDTQPEVISSFYIGVTRWFNFF